MTTEPSRYSMLNWRKSSASGGEGACVEVAHLGSLVLVRDSRDRPGSILALTGAQWLGLLRRIRAEEADPGR
jgi:hypothetical protein